MNAPGAALDHYLSRFDAFEASLRDEPVWIKSLRRAAIGHFAEVGFPSTKLEAWRHTNVAPIAEVPFELPLAPVRASREEIEALSSPVFACSLFVFVNGRFAPELSAPPALSGGVRVESLARLRAEDPERIEPHLGRVAEPKQHPFAALNTAFLNDGAVLIVPEGSRDARPIHVVFAAVADERPTVVHPRVLIVTGAESRATVIQNHVSLGGSVGFTNAVTEVRAERDSTLDLVLLQRENGESFHLSNLVLRQERGSRVATHTITLGAALVRNDLSAVLADEGAECALRGLFIGDRSQRIDNHTTIDHAMPRGASRELYKGILGGKARGVFRGRVIVRPDAQGTNAEQSNPNLLVSDEAQINSEPHLEIHADDVKCSHGSSIGRLDEDALFYVRARGIDEREARDLLIRGFANEILSGLPASPLAEGMDELLHARLESASGAGAAP